MIRLHCALCLLTLLGAVLSTQTPAGNASAEQIVSGQWFMPQIRPVSREAVAEYISGEAVAFNQLDILQQLSDLATSDLSAEEVSGWQSTLLGLVTLDGPPPPLRIHPRSGYPTGREPEFTREETVQLHAIDALFRLSTPADDPGLVAAYQDPDVPLFLRQHIWEKLVSEWGMASLPPPGEG